MKTLLLSYACCLSLAASAATYTIDSPEVGQFFKLPDWAPAEVDSEHTPGSPETVVDVFTNGTGRKAVRPFRLTPERFSSFYATFEAYYERLYYTSCGSRNVWDVSEWGPRNPDHLFRFDMPTNYPTHSSFYEPQTNRTVRTRRLVESDNLVRMYGWIRDMRAWYRPERPSWSNYHNSTFISTTVFDDMGLSVDWPENSVWGGPGNVLGQLTSEQWERTILTFEDVRKAPPDPTRTFQLDWTTGGDWFSSARGAWDAVNFGESPFSASDIYDRMLRPRFTDSEKAVTNTTEEVLAYPWGDCSLITNDFIETRRLIPGSWGRANQALACYDRSYYYPPFENMVVTGTYQRAEQERQYRKSGEPIVVEVSTRLYGTPGEALYVVATGTTGIPFPTSDDQVSERTNVTSEAVSRQFPVAYSSPVAAGGSVMLDESLYLAPGDMWAFEPLDALIGSLPWLSAGQEAECYFDESYSFVGLDMDGAAWFFVTVTYLLDDGTFGYDGALFPFGTDPVAWFGASYSIEKSYENVQVSLLDKSTIGDPVPGNFSRVTGGPGEPGCSLHFLLSSAVGAGKDGSYVSADVPVPSLLTYYEFMHGPYHRDDDQWTSRYMAYTSKYGNGDQYLAALDDAYSKVGTRCSLQVDDALGPGWRNAARMVDIGDSDVMAVFGGLSITNGTRIEWNFASDGANHIDLPSSPWPNQVLVAVTVARDAYPYDAVRIVKITCQDVASANIFDVTDEDIIAQARLQTFRNWYTLEVSANEAKRSPGAISDGRVWGIAKVDWNWNCLRLNKDE